LWDTLTGKRHGPALDYGFGSSIRVGAFSLDGLTVLLGGVAKENFETARMWDVETGKRVGAPLAHKGDVKTLAYSPDGLRIVTGSGDKTAQLWDARSGKPLGGPLVHEDAVTSVAFSPDGVLILTGSKDRTARVWNGISGAPIRVLRHDDGVSQALFSPNGQTIFTASLDKTARLWQTNTGDAIGLPWQHPASVLCAAFSPDGNVVVTGCEDGMGRFWAAETGMEMGPPLFHPNPVTAVAFNPSGKFVATACGDRAARLWDVPAPVAGDARRIALWAQVETGMELDAQGAIHTLDESTLEQRRTQLQELGGSPLLTEGQAQYMADRHLRIAMNAALGGHWLAVSWHLNHTLRLRPEDWKAWLLLGQAQFNLEQLTAAADAYAKAFELGPKESVLAACKLHIEDVSSEELNPLPSGDKYKAITEKQNRAAVWYLSQLVAHDPSNWKLYDQRGSAYASLNQVEQAEEDYHRALALGPEASFFFESQGPTNGQSGWANWHLNRMQWETAANDFAQAVQLGCENLDVLETHALLRLYVSDGAGYRRACKSLLTRSNDGLYAGALGMIGEICAAGPDATDDPWAPIPLLARAALETDFGPPHVTESNNAA
jgi:tetratricopeptide (TPR) repeat protein